MSTKNDMINWLYIVSDLMFQDFDISERVHQLLQNPPGKDQHDKVSFYFCLFFCFWRFIIYCQLIVF